MISDFLFSLFPKYTNNEFNFWNRISNIKTLSINDIEKRLNQISNIRNKRNKNLILDEYLDTIISDLIDNSGCNIIIFNLPEVHKKNIVVTSETIHDTFLDYGPIFTVHKFNDIAYIWFVHNSDAKLLCDTIDNMQCEENILQCQYTKSNLVMKNFDWKTKTTYETFNIKDFSMKLIDIDNYWKTLV